MPAKAVREGFWNATEQICGGQTGMLSHCKWMLVILVLQNTTNRIKDRVRERDWSTFWDFVWHREKSSSSLPAI